MQRMVKTIGTLWGRHLYSYRNSFHINVVEGSLVVPRGIYTIAHLDSNLDSGS